CCCLSLTAPPSTELYSLSLHDALPIWAASLLSPWAGAGAEAAFVTRLRAVRFAGAAPSDAAVASVAAGVSVTAGAPSSDRSGTRSEEHTSELQSRENLVCRLLLEKKKK